MKRAWLFVLLVLVSVTGWSVPGAVAGPGGDVTSKPARYSGYVVCGTKPSAEPATSCRKNKKKTAVFLSKDRDASYKICVTFPDKKKLCAAHQEAAEGEKAVNSITSVLAGTHKVTWSVGGEKVATYRFDVKD